MKKQKRIARTDQDLLEALMNHVNLLSEYSNRAFSKRDHNFLGEVAGKLRVLVVESRTNKPLLLALMEKYGVVIRFKLDSPFDLEELTLEEYMKRTCLGIRTSDGFKSFTNHEFVATWAQQNGAAHEDWEHDEGFAVAKTLGLFIGDQPAHARGLQSITRTVLSIAEEFFMKLQGRGFPIAKKTPTAKR